METKTLSSSAVRRAYGVVCRRTCFEKTRFCSCFGGQRKAWQKAARHRQRPLQFNEFKRSARALPRRCYGNSDLLHEYTPEAICAVFREMGLSPSRTARAGYTRRIVWRRPWHATLRWDAEIRRRFGREHTVSKIEKVKNGFTLICTDGTQLFTKQCILTCGGAASPRHSCGEGYTLAKQLRPHSDKLYPSLTQLTVRAKR